MNRWKFIAVAVCSLLANSNHATLIDVFQGLNGPHIFKGTIDAYTGTDPAAVNYDYFSHSGHPTEGPNLKFNRGELFFYEGPDGMTFNMVFNKDNQNASDPVTDGLVSWNIAEASLPPGDASVLLSDDNRELKETDPDVFKGRWQWHNNTDGGIIGGLTGDWAVLIDPKEYQGLDTLKVFSADGDRINLNLETGNKGFIFFALHPSSAPDAGGSAFMLAGGLLVLGMARRKLATAQ